MLLSSLTFFSCQDIEESHGGGEADRMFMTMFRQNDNTNISSDTYACTVFDRNNVNLYWYMVKGAYGYRIKWAIQNHVANGEDAWLQTEADGRLVGDTVLVGEENYTLTIKHLGYQTDYRFAIQVLNSADLNDPRNSKWYGYGGGRDWQDYLGMQTQARYNVPYVIQISNVTKTEMTVTLNRDISSYKDAEKEEFREHFNFVDAEKNILKIDKFTFDPSLATPNATVDAKYKSMALTEDMWVDNKCTFTVTGLSENSVYNIDVWDNDIAVKVDACYNSLLKRTKGTPLPPELIKHVPTAVDSIDNEAFDISQWNSMKLDRLFENYLNSMDYPENQVFYLEGGKAYHFVSNPNLSKGVTFQTLPEDIAAGKGRAILYMGGMIMRNGAPNAANFMMGRQPEAGENGTIPIDIDTIRFIDLHVDCPLALNLGDQGGKANGTGNYFMNMYSNGMGINVTLLEWNNCIFERAIRGFFRVQGANDFNVHNMKMIDCQHYNCGYYQTSGGGYNYLHGDHNGKTGSNVYENLEITGCVFYNSPKGNLLTDSNRNLTWNEDVRWNINIHHNTFVNFNTIGSNNMINLRYIPGGSNIKFRDNLIIVTKDEHDTNRPTGSAGFYCQKIQGGDGSGKATFEVGNNYSTSDNLTNGQIFAANAMSATTSYALGKIYQTFEKEGEDVVAQYFPMGKDGLLVTAEDIKATELMESPNPKFFIGASPVGNDYRTDTGIDGLYYQQTEKVFATQIYKQRIGAAILIDGKK